MQLFLVPADPMQTVLVSSTGEPQYVVQTDKIYDSGTRARRVTTVRKLPETESGSVLSDLDSIAEEFGASGNETDVVAQIAWKTWGTSTTVYGNLREGMQAGVRVQEFMSKRGQFSRGISRCFIGNDGKKYRWQQAWKGFDLVFNDTGERLAQFRHGLKGRGLFNGERKACLQIEKPQSSSSSLDLDLIVVSCLIMEKKRIDYGGGPGAGLADHDEDPLGEVGAEC